MSERMSKESKQFLNQNNLEKVIPPILALDYGEKNIGIAITDKKGVIASPLEVYRVSKKKDDSFNQKLLNLIEKYNIKTIVIGMPQKLHEKHEESQRNIIGFKSEIEKLTSLKLFLYDESYSTIDSYNELRGYGIKQKKAKKKIDKFAAATFLQELIDLKNRSNES